MIQQGDIFFVNQYNDQSKAPESKRPFIVLSNKFMNNYYNRVLCVPLTSNSRFNKYKTTFEIPENLSKLPIKSYALILDSIFLDVNLLTDRISTLPQSIIDSLVNIWIKYVISSNATSIKSTDYSFEINDSLVYDCKYPKEENINYEFKEIRSEDNYHDIIKKSILKYICSFLNSKGGRILYGITDKRIIKGIELSSEQKDNIRQLIFSKIYDIKPKVIADDFIIEFIPVIKNNQTHNNLFVIEISIPAAFDKTIIYLSNDNKLYVRYDGTSQELDIIEMQTIVKKRLIDSLNNK
ncbi:hypothetical protein CIW83_09740 [Tissierella sp. P1]|uniref:RNA-binding domain-containing protein n=1 Tax=Tissierella sp. P1 TaxID=1280483 RepID=UPI000BA0CDB3|nr:RNA-binding domain-containing protein [Tissierella sp. P1]OZV12367.1 hypothetical protein CIW83_09740 [Tissierella sp. P1]